MGRKATSFLIYGLSIILTAIIAVITLTAANPCNSANSSALSYFTGLLLPVLIILNIFYAIYWLIRRKWLICLIPAAAIAGSYNYYTTIYRFNDKKTAEILMQKEKENNLRILTYNTGNFLNKDGIRFAHTMADFLQSQNIDIACFQEYALQGRFKDTVGRIMDAYPYSISNADNKNIQLAVYSKYPITESRYEQYPSSNDGYIISTVALCGKELIDKETSEALRKYSVLPDSIADIPLHIRDSLAKNVTDSLIGLSPKIILINTHLQSTGVSTTDMDAKEIKKAGGDIGTIEIAKTLTARMSWSAVMRVQQIEILSALIEKQTYPVILCGDFNETPLSYVYNRTASQLKDGFKEGGQGYMYTYKYLGKILRIDYIFHSRGMESVKYFSPDKEWSDHNPVISELEFTDTQPSVPRS